MRGSDETWYEVLGLRENSTPQDIVRAYRRKAKETHPDKAGGCKETFQKLSEAYEILSNRGKREAYHNTLRARRYEDREGQELFY